MRIKTIVDSAERELATELLTHSSDKHRSLPQLPAVPKGSSPTPCPQDKGIRVDKGDSFCPDCQHDHIGVVHVPFTLYCSPKCTTIRNNAQRLTTRNKCRRKQGWEENSRRQVMKPFLHASLFNKTHLFLKVFLTAAKSPYSHSVSALASLDYVHIAVQE